MPPFKIVTCPLSFISFVHYILGCSLFDFLYFEMFLLMFFHKLWDVLFYVLTLWNVLVRFLHFELFFFCVLSQSETRSVRTEWWSCATKVSVRPSLCSARAESTSLVFARSASSRRNGHVSSSPRPSPSSFPVSACVPAPLVRVSAAASTSVFACRWLFCCHVFDVFIKISVTGGGCGDLWKCSAAYCWKWAINLRSL